MSDVLKDCPYCGETIKAVAIRCKHCHADLPLELSVIRIATDTSSPGDPHASTVTSHISNRPPVTLDLPNITDLLSHLVERSLVVFDDKTLRYRLLESVRQYARDRLRECGGGEEEKWSDRHRDWCVALTEEAYDKRFTDESPAMMNVLDSEHDNCRAALEHCGAGSDAQTHLRLAGAMQKLWEYRGFLREGRDYLNAALSRPDGLEPTAARARALIGAGILAAYQNDTETSRALFERSAAIWRAMGEKKLLAFVLNNLGVVERQELRYEAAEAFFDESLALMRELNDRPGMAIVFSNFGTLASQQNDLVRARSFLEETIALSRETGNLYVMEESSRDLAQVTMKLGDYAAARVQYREVLALLTVSRNEENLILVQESMAELAACLQRPQDGVRLFAAAAAARQRVGIPIRTNERADYERREQLLRSAFDANTFAKEWATGSAMTTEEAIDLARDSCHV